LINYKFILKEDSKEGNNLLEKALFVNYGGGRRTQRNNQILVRIDQVNDENKAAKYIGRKVTWKSPSGNTLTGKIIRVHGGNGLLKAIFKKGLPGQAVGKELNIN